jgi:hypothetical protein
MSTLILVDGDNCLTGRAVSWLVGEVSRWASQFRPPRSMTGPWRCVLALNTETASDFGSLEALRKFARQLCNSICPGSIGETEIVLCATMPQTADVALLRLATEAPDAGGLYDGLVLLSSDRELGRQVSTLAESCNGILADSGLQRTVGGRAWRWGTGGGLRRRAVLSAKARPPGSPPASLACHSLAIDSLGLAGWAYGRDLDVPPNSDLPAIATRITEQPVLLSQLGLTTQSVRGVGRLGRMPGTGAIGDCSDREGLEILGELSCSGIATSARPASVGAGAICLEDGVTGSVGTRLPPRFLTQAGGPYPVEERGTPGQRYAVLDDNRLLARLAPWNPLGAEVDVEFATRGKTARVRVKSRAAKMQAEAWWVGDSRCTTELRIDALQDMIPQAVVAAAAAMPLPPATRFPPGGAFAGSRARVGLRSPHRDSIEVRVDPRGDIAAGTIGQGWVEKRPAALLAAGRSWTAGTSVLCVPVQDIPWAERRVIRSSLPQGAAEWLDLLPILAVMNQRS